jgi:tetratricopeptide (TPR) repeat protein
VRAIFLRPDGRIAQALDSALRAVRWDTLPALDRNFSLAVKAFIAADDLPTVRRLIDEWRRTTPPEVELQQRDQLTAAQGELALAEGDARTALRLFRLADVGRCESCAATRLARAFDKLGQSDSVIASYERAIAHPVSGELSRESFDEIVRAYRRLGELYEAKGDTKRAIQRYSDFVELWRNADPSLQPLVKDVRERIARLQRKTG